MEGPIYEKLAKFITIIKQEDELDAFVSTKIFFDVDLKNGERSEEQIFGLKVGYKYKRERWKLHTLWVSGMGNHSNILNLIIKNPHFNMEFPFHYYLPLDSSIIEFIQMIGMMKNEKTGNKKQVKLLIIKCTTNNIIYYVAFLIDKMPKTWTKINYLVSKNIIDSESYED